MFYAGHFTGHFPRIEPCWTKCPAMLEPPAGHQQKSAGHVRHVRHISRGLVWEFFMIHECYMLILHFCLIFCFRVVEYLIKEIKTNQSNSRQSYMYFEFESHVWESLPIPYQDLESNVRSHTSLRQRENKSIINKNCTSKPY